MTSPSPAARWRVAAFSLAVLAVSACSLRVLRGYAEAPSTPLARLAPTEDVSGVARFAFDALGSLNTDALQTHAIPWKILVATLLVERRRAGANVAFTEEAVLPILQEFGFFVPDTILNWGNDRYPETFDAPLGLLRGRAARSFPRVDVEIANLGCASCHGGVTYDSVGMPTKAAWLGLPNTSLDLDAYSDALFVALWGLVERPDEMVAALDTLYPDMPASERRTLTGMIIPRIRAELPRLKEAYDAFGPYDPGGPGSTNGVGSFKHVLGLNRPGEYDSDASSVSTPDLGDRFLRTSVTVDGTQGLPDQPRFAPMTPDDVTERHLSALAGVVGFFSVGAMGVRPGHVRVERVRQIVAEFVRYYRPPPFPGPVDRTLAERGQALYADWCAACHGRYSPMPEPQLQEFPNRLVDGDEIGTDPARWQAPTADLIRAAHATAHGRYLNMANTGGYVAPPLTGVWATAPYLHNGSVPTLRHLMNLAGRPVRFQVGGHALDFERVGIAGELDDAGTYRYPSSYVPWSEPVVFDTERPGQGNGGHEAPFAGLTEAQRVAILEYLKLL